MGFIDEIKRLARPYEDEEDEEEFDDFEPPVSRVERKEKARDARESTGTLYSADPEPRRSNKVVNIHTTTQLQVVLVKPDRFENAAEIADHLREKRTVVLNLEQTNKDIARRLLDFLSGVAYANEGKIKKVAISTYHHALSCGYLGRPDRRAGEQLIVFLRRAEAASRANKTERRQKTGARNARHFCEAAGLFARMRASRSVTGEKRGAHGNRHTEGRPRGPRKAARLCGERRKNGAQRMPDVRPAEQSGVSSDDEARRCKERFALRHTCPITFYR